MSDLSSPNLPQQPAPTQQSPNAAPVEVRSEANVGTGPRLAEPARRSTTLLVLGIIGIAIGALVLLVVVVFIMAGLGPIAFGISGILALIPLAIVLLGIDETPKIFVIFLAAFLACVIATFQGVVNVDKTLINAARVLGAKDGRIFLRVVIPASTPFILVGMRVGLGSSWATLVAAELIAAQQGLGYRMQNAQLYYDLATIFVALITIGILGLLMDRILLFAERKLTGWQERR